MRNLRPLALSSLLGVSLLAMQVAPAFAQACSCPPADSSAAGPAGPAAVGVTVYADDPPPPLPEYEQPPIPADGDIWTPGYWAWNGYDYFWVPGTWVEPPQPGLLWTPGYWAFANGVYGFHRGYWGEHVGFYGGVNYGFGYVGVGFEGGHWDNGHYFYNRSVTNIGEVKIVNVYNQTINVREETRVSFNGGPNGVDAKPSDAELAAAKEQHVAPTKDQMRNGRVASRTDSAFVSDNKGKPSIAATAKPGSFKGEGVVHAKAAGGPLTPQGGATPEATKTPNEKKGDESKKGDEPKTEATKTPSDNKLDQPKTDQPKTDQLKSDQPKTDESKPKATPTPTPTRTEMEKKLDQPKNDQLKNDQPKTDQPKTDQPKTEPTKPEMKMDRPKPEPTRTEPDMKMDQPKSEPKPMPEMKMDRPKQDSGPGPQSKPQGGGKPERACGHPGEPACH